MRVRGGGLYEKHRAVKGVDKEGEDVARLRLKVLLR
jgi:hypothetical protein